MTFSLNNNAARLIEDYVRPNKDRLNIDIYKLENGTTILDMGVHAKGGWLAAKAFVDIGLGGLGELSYRKLKIGSNYVPALSVLVDRPSIAEMSSHVARFRVPYKGRNIDLSGPIRSIKGVDEFARAVDYRDVEAKSAVGCIQTTVIPTAEAADLIAGAAGVDPKQLYLVVARTGNIVGAVQVGSRNIEQTLPTLFDHGFNMDDIIQATGITPMISIVDDELVAYGRVNDSLIYGQETNVYLRCEDEKILGVLDELTFVKNKDIYGTPFQEIFARCDNDWTHVPRDWDAPCKINFHNLSSGRSFSTGMLGYQTLENSFLGQ